MAVFFNVAAFEEDVEGGEAETLLTTEETMERSTGFWLVWVMISRVLERDLRFSDKSSRPGLGSFTLSKSA